MNVKRLAKIGKLIRVITFLYIVLPFTYLVYHQIGNREDVSKNLLSGFSIQHASGNTMHDKGR